MELIAIIDFCLIDQNKAGGKAVFDLEGKAVEAEMFFYLQGYDCLSIRAGRHDDALSTTKLEDFIKRNRYTLRQMVKSDIKRVREEQHRLLGWNQA